MKRFIGTLLLIWLATSAFSADFVLDNQTSHPANAQKPNIAIQWASSAKEIEESRRVVEQGLTWHTGALKFLNQTGKITLTSPKTAEYFRILVWSKATESPDFVTNWVNIVPHKTYTLNTKHLVPIALVAGTGC